MDFWSVFAKIVDVIGVASFGISIATLVNTRKIRSSRLAHVETSEYRMAIDEQISDLEVYQALLVDGDGLDSAVFLQLMVLVRNISIAYETILPKKVFGKLGTLYTHIQTNLYTKESPYAQKDLEKCISMLIYVINELKKEKKMI